MRYLLLALLALTPAPIAAADIPLVVIGLPFAPESPTPVGPDHPLYHRVEVADIDELPSAVRTSALNILAAAKRSSINAGLRETLRRMNLLALDSASARVRLISTWRGSDTPFKIFTSHNAASVTLRYRLLRIDDGRQLFDREISTSVKGGGVDATMRDEGVLRAAIATNFASVANCLDRAAYGTAPADCALTPKFAVTVVRRH